MQKLLVIVGFLFLISCSKNSDNNNNATVVDYSGNYKGDISVTVNGSPSTGLTAYTITMAQISTTAGVLSNNVFAAVNGTFAAGTFTLTKRVTPISLTSNLEQYGTATFNGTTMVINFHEDEVQTSNNAVLSTKVWTGTLTKQ